MSVFFWKGRGSNSEGFTSIHWSFYEKFFRASSSSSSPLDCVSAHLVDRCGRAAESQQHLGTRSPFENKREKTQDKQQLQNKNMQSDTVEGSWDLNKEVSAPTESLPKN